jgi:hypothetical protein
MEKQMRAEREKRAAILTAEGLRQSSILTAEGEKQSAILRAEGAKQSAILRAEGESQAIEQVFQAIHNNDPDPKLLAYQYLQTLPQLAAGEGNTFWVIPGELTSALQSVTKAFAGTGGGDGDRGASDRSDNAGSARAEDAGDTVPPDAVLPNTGPAKLTQNPDPKPIEAVDQPKGPPAIAPGPTAMPAQANGAAVDGIARD